MGLHGSGWRAAFGRALPIFFKAVIGVNAQILDKSTGEGRVPMAQKNEVEFSRIWSNLLECPPRLLQRKYECSAYDFDGAGFFSRIKSD
jgi:hypothetical protein